MSGDTTSLERMQQVVETLCSEKCMPRNPGTLGGAAARDFLRDELAALELVPAGEKDFDQAILLNGGTNLLASIRGKRDRYVILAAHYDACWIDNPGADDNAAAVAVTLEVARQLRDADPFRSIIIALFDAEEPPHFLGPGMGSQWFVDHPTMPLNKIDTMVCLDLVGHALGPEGLPAAVRDSVFVLGAEKSTGTPQLVDDLPVRDGIVPRRIDNYIIDPMSDYDAFMKAEIPFLFYSCGRTEHYHMPTDTPDRLDYRKMAALVNHLTDLMATLADRPGVPSYLVDGVDDAGTLRSLASVAANLSSLSPQAAMASVVIAELQTELEATEALPDEGRAMVRFLVAGIEEALA